MRNNPKTILFCTGCLSALAMAPVYFWPLMILGYSILVYILSTQAQGLKQTALFGFLFFFGYFLTGLYWTSSSLFVEFDRWWWALPFSFAGLPILLALTPAIFIASTAYLRRYKALAIIIALILTDITRSVIFTGFPWNMPIHGFKNVDAVMALLPYLHFHPLNAITIFFISLPALLVLQHRKYTVVGLSIYALFCIAFLCISPPNQADTSTIPDNLVMAQANIPQKEKWAYEYRQRNLTRYIEMTLSKVKPDEAALVIWPETAISQSLFSYPQLKRQFYDFLNTLPKGSILVTGYLYSTHEGHFNALAVLNTQGDILDIYNKHHLVPFGEYMPFGLDTLTGVSNFQHGEIPRTIRIDKQNLDFLPLICYEIIFSSYSQHVTENSIILNITNDAWFGNTAGPYQHFDHAIFRAVENKKLVLRLSGNGLSGIIMPDGSVLNQSPLNKTALITSP